MKNDCGKYDSYSDGGLPNGPYQEPVKGDVQAATVAELPAGIPTYDRLGVQTKAHYTAAQMRDYVLADRAARRSTEGWVSVEDRLPEYNPRKGSLGVQVLIWPRHLNSDLGAMFYGRRQTDEPNFYIHGEVLHGVTHWQPMPLPPAPTSAAEEKGQES